MGDTWKPDGEKIGSPIMFKVESQLITTVEFDSGSVRLCVDGEAGVPLVCAVSKGAGPAAGDLVPVLCILRDATQ